jgi:hypothetical protein
MQIHRKDVGCLPIWLVEPGRRLTIYQFLFFFYLFAFNYNPESALSESSTGNSGFGFIQTSKEE